MRRIALLAGLSILAIGPAQMQMGSNHKFIAPEDVKWGPAPPALPAGAKFAVLTGDPSKEGAFTIRATLPEGYKVPPHWHPTTEHVTVLKGEIYMGMGDKLDLNKATLMKPGSFAEMPAKTNHFVQAKSEVIIQVHAMGPFELTYVDPKDDPRKQ
jgi:quercetin dioxygenase-like cupin family protein